MIKQSDFKDNLKNKLPTIVILAIGFIIQAYGILIFDGFHLFTGKSSFKILIYAFFLLYILLSIYIVFSKRKNGNSTVVILTFLFALLVLAFPITNRYDSNISFYSYRYNSSNHLLRDDQDDADMNNIEVFSSYYLSGKTLKLYSSDLFDMDNQIMQYNLYDCTFDYQKEPIIFDAKTAAKIKNDAHTVTYTLEDSNKNICFYCADNHKTQNIFVLGYDSDMNAYFIPEMLKDSFNEE